MRDGVDLSCYIYMPDTEPPHPVLLILRTTAGLKGESIMQNIMLKYDNHAEH